MSVLLWYMSCIAFWMGGGNVEEFRFSSKIKVWRVQHD
jgi:hypothetical protein